MAAAEAAPMVEPHFDTVHAEETIIVRFSGGPGNAKDWIGVYPSGIVPEEAPGPELWAYVDGSESGLTGASDGSVTLSDGLPYAGVWNVYFFLDDGFDVLASNEIVVLDRSQPILRAAQPTYEAHTPIGISFASAPGNPKDWIGIYRAGENPGSDSPTLRLYLDGTEEGEEGWTEGGVTFFSGVRQAGVYEAHLFRNDTTEILASTSFEVTPGVEIPPVLGPVSPADGTSNLPPRLEFSAVFTNGTSLIVPGSVTLSLNGTRVPVVPTAVSNQLVVGYQDPNLALAGAHTWVLTARDDATPPNTFEAVSTVTVASYRDLRIPVPIYFLDFDSVPEGSLPPGWSHDSYSTPLTSGENFQALSSASYSRWTSVRASRFADLFSIYGESDNLIGDYIRVLSVNLFNVINGAVYDEPLPRGNFLFANSGFQNNMGSQVLYLTTSDFDLTGQAGVHLSFKSIWEQNENSIAAIEYSIDRGISWLPVAYYLDPADIVVVPDATSGGFSVDAMATFNRRHNDVAVYADASGVQVGGAYGDYISAPISSALGPHLFSRMDDDPVDSKRIELFELPQADDQPAVRFRFTHAGRDSWYFGIDDFGLYPIPSVPGGAPRVSVARTVDGILLSWPADADGFTLETASSLGSSNWAPVSGVTGNSHLLTTPALQAYFRLRQ
jgi:hypothetical protein